MRFLLFKAISCAVALGLSGCYTTEYFIDNRRSMTDTQVCGNWRESWRGQYNKALHVATLDELNRRKVSTEQCRQMLVPVDALMAQSANATGALAAILLIGAAAKYGSPAAISPSPVTDKEWEWDQFLGASGQAVWACRGVQTAQFAHEFLCLGPKVDMRWPGLSAPR